MQMIHIRKINASHNKILDYDSQGREKIVIDPFIFFEKEFANDDELISYHGSVRQSILDIIDKYEAISLNNLLFEIASLLIETYYAQKIKIEIDDEAQSHYFVDGAHEVKIGDWFYTINTTTTKYNCVQKT